MLTLTIAPNVVSELCEALARAGHREIGGILMAEHTGLNRFHICEVSIHRIGSFGSFIRRIEEALTTLKSFFSRTRKQYTKFNYLGEWHSHPSFEPRPSQRDHASMIEIATDRSIGANFVVLVIIKLDDVGKMIGTAHTYLPNGAIERADLVLAGKPGQMPPGVSILA